MKVLTHQLLFLVNEKSEQCKMMTVVFIQWLHLSLSQVLSEFQAAFVQFQTSLSGCRLVLHAKKTQKGNYDLHCSLEYKQEEEKLLKR